MEVVKQPGKWGGDTVSLSFQVTLLRLSLPPPLFIKELENVPFALFQRIEIILKQFCKDVNKC